MPIDQVITWTFNPAPRGRGPRHTFQPWDKEDNYAYIWKFLNAEKNHEVVRPKPDLQTLHSIFEEAEKYKGDLLLDVYRVISLGTASTTVAPVRLVLSQDRAKQIQQAAYWASVKFNRWKSIALLSDGALVGEREWKDQASERCIVLAENVLALKRTRELYYLQPSRPLLTPGLQTEAECQGSVSPPEVQLPLKGEVSGWANWLKRQM